MRRRFNRELSNKMVVFEGADGAGKTTLIKNLMEFGFKHYDKMDIYKFGIEEYIDSYHFGIKNLENMYSINKRLEWRDIEPNRLIMIDRYYYSTLAYNVPNCNNINQVNIIEKMINELIPPALVVYLQPKNYYVKEDTKFDPKTIDKYYMNVFKEYRERDGFELLIIDEELINNTKVLSSIIEAILVSKSREL